MLFKALGQCHRHWPRTFCCPKIKNDRLYRAKSPGYASYLKKCSGNGKSKLTRPNVSFCFTIDPYFMQDAGKQKQNPTKKELNMKKQVTRHTAILASFAVAAAAESSTTAATSAAAADTAATETTEAAAASTESASTVDIVNDYNKPRSCSQSSRWRIRPQ